MNESADVDEHIHLFDYLKNDGSIIAYKAGILFENYEMWKIFLYDFCFALMINYQTPGTIEQLLILIHQNEDCTYKTLGYALCSSSGALYSSVNNKADSFFCFGNLPSKTYIGIKKVLRFQILPKGIRALRLCDAIMNCPPSNITLEVSDNGLFEFVDKFTWESKSYKKILPASEVFIFSTGTGGYKRIIDSLTVKKKSYPVSRLLKAFDQEDYFVLYRRFIKTYIFSLNRRINGVSIPYLIMNRIVYYILAKNRPALIESYVSQQKSVINQISNLKRKLPQKTPAPNKKLKKLCKSVFQ